MSCGDAGANEVVVGELRGEFWRIFGVVAADCGNFCGVAELTRGERRRAVVFVVVDICGVGGELDCFKLGILFEDALDFLVFGVSAIFRRRKRWLKGGVKNYKESNLAGKWLLLWGNLHR